MNYTKLLPLLLVGIILTACAEQNNNTNKETGVHLPSKEGLAIPKPEGLKTAIPLTPQAKTAIANWDFYNGLTEAIDNIYQPTLSGVQLELKKLDEVYKVSKEALEADAPVRPQEVDTKAINARLLAIETRFNALENAANLNSPNAEDISQKIASLKNARQNLNLQLNEVYNTSIKELLEEIKAENASTSEIAEPVGNVNEQQELK